jgi:hypothetical protein
MFDLCPFVKWSGIQMVCPEHDHLITGMSCFQMVTVYFYDEKIVVIFSDITSTDLTLVNTLFETKMSRYFVHRYVSCIAGLMQTST